MDLNGSAVGCMWMILGLLSMTCLRSLRAKGTSSDYVCEQVAECQSYASSLSPACSKSSASVPRKDGAEDGIGAHGWSIAVRTRKPEMSLRESRQSPRQHVPLLMNTSKYSKLLTTLKSTLSKKHNHEAGTWHCS